MSIRDEIEDFLRNFGVFKIGVADPAMGFGLAKSGCHPRDSVKNCKSVIVLAFHVGFDHYATLDYCQKGNVES